MLPINLLYKIYEMYNNSMSITVNIFCAVLNESPLAAEVVYCIKKMFIAEELVN